MADEKAVKDFNITDLKEAEQKDFNFVKTRLEELKQARKSHYGVDLDALWAEADRDYVPHRLTASGKRVLVENDESKGWRGTSSLVKLGSRNWQSDVSQANVFVKVQTAMATLVDQNPTGVLTALTKKYQATTELIRQLYQRSWEYARSKEQLKLFVFNLAKYGWAVGRTYPLRVERKVRKLVSVNEGDPSKNVYEEQTVIEYNDIYRENLDVRNVWIDDMARPNSPRSTKDWCWRKVYDKDVARDEFGKYARFEQAMKASGITAETIENTESNNQQTTTDQSRLCEVFFYENRIKDIFMVVINGVPVVIEPLPIADANGAKRLSLWQAYWTLRHTESPYGIGIYEAVRYDQAVLDRFRNMTIDQLTLAIYKMFFYQGTSTLQDTGEIPITPGVGKQIIDPKNIKFLEIPGPGREAFEGIKMFKADVDETSGITPTLQGEVTGKTAFEIAQAKESALKRLKNPLGNILEALNEEGYTTVALIQLIYSIPETYEISDPELIQKYLEETGSDPELFERAPGVDELGNETDNFVAKVYPEFPLNLDTDEGDNLVETEDTKFFRIKPKYLEWKGIVNIKAQSLLTPSKQVDKALDLEMFNMLIPLLGNPPQLYHKIAKELIKLYDKDPKALLPEIWLNEQLMQQQVAAEQQAQEPLFVGEGGEEAQSLVSSTQAPSNPQSLIGRISSRITAPFRV